MSGHHEKCDPQEIFLGNTQREGGSLDALTTKGLKTIRLGKVAYDIEGKPLSPAYAPLFIHRGEEARHDAIMMEKTFGPNWRR